MENRTGHKKIGMIFEGNFGSPYFLRGNLCWTIQKLDQILLSFFICLVSPQFNYSVEQISTSSLKP